MQRIAVLYARKDSIYKTLEECDVWDESRDALMWSGGVPVVAHPPCREWGRLHRFSKAPAHERYLAIWAVWMVRAYGGVLEHPVASKLWSEMRLPAPGEPADEWGGFSIQVNQCDWGHPAEKATLLYVVRATLPPMPAPRQPTHVVKPGNMIDRLPICTHKWREATPLPFAQWLVAVARSVAQ